MSLRRDFHRETLLPGQNDPEPGQRLPDYAVYPRHVCVVIRSRRRMMRGGESRE